MNKQKAFTIVETLVAITVLMIAIAGPLTLSSKALTAAVDAQNTLIAINLAQSEMEYISFVKDVDGFSRLINCTSSDKCGASPWHGGSVNTFADNIKRCNNGMNDCKLTYNSVDGYTYDKLNAGSPNVATVFARHFYVERKGSDDQYLVTTEVLWTTGSVPNSVKMQQIMTTAVR